MWISFLCRCRIVSWRRTVCFYNLTTGGQQFCGPPPRPDVILFLCASTTAGNVEILLSPQHEEYTHSGSFYIQSCLSILNILRLYFILFLFSFFFKDLRVFLRRSLPFYGVYIFIKELDVIVCLPMMRDSYNKGSPPKRRKKYSR